MEFWVGIYGLNFCYNFSKLFLKIEKLISFMLCPNKRLGPQLFLVPGNKSYAQKKGEGATKKL